MSTTHITVEEDRSKIVDDIFAVWELDVGTHNINPEIVRPIAPISDAKSELRSKYGRLNFPKQSNMAKNPIIIMDIKQSYNIGLR